MLAVLIRSPSRYDPEANPEGAAGPLGPGARRDGRGGLAGRRGARRASTYPPVQQKAGSDAGHPERPGGADRAAGARTSCVAKGYTEQQIYAGGLRITTTVDKGCAGRRGRRRSTTSWTGEPENLRQALVADRPEDRRRPRLLRRPVRRRHRLRAGPAPAGLVDEALRAGHRARAGHQRRRPPRRQLAAGFQDREAPVRNSGGASCAACTLQGGHGPVAEHHLLRPGLRGRPGEGGRDIRAAAGCPTTWEGGFLEGKPTLANADGGTGSAIGIGEYEMRPIDQAHGFATFAAGGIERDAALRRQGRPTAPARCCWRTAATAGEQVIAPDVANDVTYALEGVAAYSERSLDGGREVASKTGTQGWTRRTTPTPGWSATRRRSPRRSGWAPTPASRSSTSRRIIYGSGLPGAIWQQFMNTRPRRHAGGGPARPADHRGRHR